MIPDQDILKGEDPTTPGREDLDNLDAAADTDRYWSVLNGIVRRIQEREDA